MPSEDDAHVDELNEATFGDDAFTNIHEDFVFGSTPKSSSTATGGHLPFFDPAIVSMGSVGSAPRSPAAFPVYKSMDDFEDDDDDDYGNYDDDDQLLPPGMQPIMPVSPMATAAPKKTLTMEEIEAQFNKTKLKEASDLRGNWLAPHNRKPALITFPIRPERSQRRDRHNDHDKSDDGGDVFGTSPMASFSSPLSSSIHSQSQSHSQLAKNDPLHPIETRWGIMTRFEREGIARIHLSQLTSENPDIEDYYYKSLAKRIAKKKASQGGSENVLYLPLPTPHQSKKGATASNASSTPNAKEREKEREREQREREREKEREKVKEALAGALGKISASTSRKPRQQLQVPSIATDSKSTAFSVSNAVESILGALFTVEDAIDQLTQSGNTSDQEEPSSCNAELLANRKRAAVEVIRRELLLKAADSDNQDDEEEGIARLLAIVAKSKGKKAIGRAIKTLDDRDLADDFAHRLIMALEYLDVCRPDVPEGEVTLFINGLLSALVPFVAKMESAKVIALLKLLCTKSSIQWIITTKAGLVLTCILLSRMELIKSREDAATIDASFYTLMEAFFDAIQERLGDLFTSLHGADGDFYGWQFLALLALSLDADRKRQLVLEMRERILFVVQVQGDPKAIANLNIFLNALGLDASQLSQ